MRLAAFRPFLVTLAAVAGASAAPHALAQSAPVLLPLATVASEPQLPAELTSEG